MQLDGVSVADTFGCFLEVWPALLAAKPMARPAIWLNRYMTRFPALLQLQLDSYAHDGVPWESVAAARVFPLLPANINRMREAHACLPDVVEDVVRVSRARFGFPQSVTIVIYVGIGCGGGWATTYEGQDAVLLGLEKIAECAWHTSPRLFGLLAHEFGHLFQKNCRGGQEDVGASDQFRMLFEEGFAQRFEHWILGAEEWNLSKGINDDSWLTWCTANRSRLAADYLRLARTRRPTEHFFGDWLHVEGRKHVGYYLGHEFVRALEGSMSPREIAGLSDIDGAAERFLIHLSGLPD